MRDLVLFIAVFGLLPFILRNAYVGVLAWSWLSYMNPHRLTWGPAYDFPFAQLVALTLFASLVFNREKKHFPVNGLIIVWLMFLLWTVVSTYFAYYPDAAWGYFPQVIKIQLIIFISLWMMGSPERIKLMVWVIFLSIGFFGIKGGIFTIKTAGGGRIFGPAGSFIADNNHLAVAMLMVLPLGFYLRKHEVTRKLYKNLITVSLLLITLAIIASYSRGAFLAITAVAIYLWWKTPSKVITGVLGSVVLATFVVFMPDAWMDRMASITEYDQDKSALGRLNAWGYAVNIASDRITGGGYQSWSVETFQQWAESSASVAVAHSIYFAVLADHGWVGLLLFLLVFTMGWRMAGRLVKFTARSKHEDAAWIGDLAKMIRVSFVAYAVGGAFLSLAYFDLPWHLLGIVVLLDQLARQREIIPQRAGARHPVPATVRNTPPA